MPHEHERTTIEPTSPLSKRVYVQNGRQVCVVTITHGARALSVAALAWMIGACGAHVHVDAASGGHGGGDSSDGSGGSEGTATSSSSGVSGEGGGSTVTGVGGSGGSGGCAAGVGSTSYDAAADFSAVQNPAGPWSYGQSSFMGAPLELYPAVMLLGEDKLQVWQVPNAPMGPAPCVAFNPNDFTVVFSSVTMPPKSLSFHPGPNGEHSVVRWTAPAFGPHQVVVTWTALDTTTTDVAVLGPGSVQLFAGDVGVGSPASFSTSVVVQCGDTIDFMVGFGKNGSYFHDTTRLEATITAM